MTEKPEEFDESRFIYCNNCLYWSGNELGQCRRNTPTTENKYHKAVWPSTKASDWCGEWKHRKVPEQNYDVKLDKFIEKSDRSRW
ncbi:hypothetical protein LCGC14_2659900 [marine sediment metagenome]|uniref:Uncharacterized protein n=1 Tax=marine sediment metagenome TaxID=412755 RepID=A0A0F9C2G8_9ZZZZ